MTVLPLAEASAVTFKATYTVDPYQSSSSTGTQIAISGILPQLNFTLDDPGDWSGYIKLFKVTIKEAIDTGNDQNSSPIGVNFTFTAPAPYDDDDNVAGSIHGTTTGIATYHNYHDKLVIDWTDSPLTLTFADAVLQIILKDTEISCGGTKYSDKCKNDSEYVKAKFKFIEVPEAPPPSSEVPLPAALPLFFSGMGMLGAMVCRRKRKIRMAA